MTPERERKEQVISVGKIGTKPTQTNNLSINFGFSGFILFFPLSFLLSFSFPLLCVCACRTRLGFFKSVKQNNNNDNCHKISSFWTSYIQVFNLCDLKKRFRESWEDGISNGKADRFLAASTLPGAAAVEGGQRPGVLAAARLNFLKYLTTVCSLWPVCNSFLADTFQLIISVVLIWSSLFNSFPVKQECSRDKDIFHLAIGEIHEMCSQGTYAGRDLRRKELRWAFFCLSSKQPIGLHILFQPLLSISSLIKSCFSLALLMYRTFTRSLSWWYTSWTSIERSSLSTRMPRMCTYQTFW